MRWVQTLFAALAVALAAAACSPPPSAAVAATKTDAQQLAIRIMGLRSHPLTLPSAKAADIAGLVAALPKTITVSFDKLEFDPGLGADIVHKLKITPAGQPGVGVAIDEVRIWGLDAELAKARLAGRRLTESASLARRLEASSITLFGLETLMAPALKASNDSLAATAGAIAPGVGPGSLPASEITRYEASLDKLLIDDLRLRPFELQTKQLPADSTWAAVLPPLQVFAAYAHAVAIDTMAYDGLKATSAIKQGTQSVALSVALANLAYRGWRGGDVDFASLGDMKMDLTTTAPIEPNAPSVPMHLTAGIDAYTLEKMRLDKLLGYLARGVVPPRDDKDLMSLGVLHLVGERARINDRDIYSVGNATIDLSGFSWFIPTHLKFDAHDIVYDVGGILGWVDEMARAASARDPLDPRVVETLKRHALDKPTMDASAGWDWNAQTGAAHISASYGLKHYFAFDFKSDMGFPDFKSVSDLIPGGFETAKQEALTTLFKQRATLNSAEANYVDQGGLNNGFALAVELMALLPAEQQQSLGPLRAATPGSLRQLASSGVYAISEEVAKSTPGLREMLRSIGAFIDKGGALHLRAKPEKPVAFSAFAEAHEPQQIFDLLKLALVHQPPTDATPNPPRP